MQTLTKLDKVLIEDYYHDNYRWKRELDETNTSIVNLILKTSRPLLYIYIYFKFLNSLF